MQSINRAACRRSRREFAKHPQWGTLEEFARGRIQSWLQDVLEEEVAELLGRGKSQRRAAVDAPAGYRNGHGKTRRLSMMAMVASRRLAKALALSTPPASGLTMTVSPS